jgi:hypothetical protein
MKTVNAEKDFRIWCEHCSIRIAPHEAKVVASGKTYHQRCHLKVHTAAPAPVAAGASEPTGGRK